MTQKGVGRSCSWLGPGLAVASAVVVALLRFGGRGALEQPRTNAVSNIGKQAYGSLESDKTAVSTDPSLAQATDRAPHRMRCSAARQMRARRRSRR